ncbi:hypothetical protein [Arcticibacter sp. MXS-1]|uniref:hypothetical protein n=1 Tax=Arcticibacter sp. MXS-1 TaxID=3341726 RepID=UPI0035A977F7
MSTNEGEMLLIRKNQLGELTKMPLNGKPYQTVVICLKEDLLRQIALEEQIETGGSIPVPPMYSFLRTSSFVPFFTL